MIWSGLDHKNIVRYYEVLLSCYRFFYIYILSIVQNFIFAAHLTHCLFWQSWVENKFSGEIGETWEGGKIVRTKPCLYLQLELCER